MELEQQVIWVYCPPNYKKESQSPDAQKYKGNGRSNSRGEKTTNLAPPHLASQNTKLHKKSFVRKKTFFSLN